MVECSTPEVAAALDAVKDFAAKVGASAKLQKALDYLGSYGQFGGTETRCVLFTDFADHSFCFKLQRRQTGENEYRDWFHGGLIYSGPGLPADGSSPSLTVALDPKAATGAEHMWSIHT
jgi:hypothetical protein